MYILRTGTDLGQLISENPQDFRQELDEAPILLVIQSAVMQRWFKQEATRRLGMTFMPRIMMPDKAWRLLLNSMGSPESPREPLFMDDLILLCYKHLKDIRREIASRSAKGLELASLYEPVLPWMGFARGGEEGRELVRIHQADQLFTLANECAGVFFNYAQNPRELATGEGLMDLWHGGQARYCETMLAEHGLGHSGFGSTMIRHEAWQAHLFRLLDIYPHDAVGAPATQGGGSILGLLMARAVRQNLGYKGPWKKLVVFGSSFLSRQAFDFVRWLGAPEGAGLDVHHYLFLPAPGALEGSQAVRWGELGRDLLARMGQAGLADALGSAGTKSTTQGTSQQGDLELIRALCEGRADASTQADRATARARDCSGNPAACLSVAGEELERKARSTEGRGPRNEPFLHGDGSFRIVSGPGMGRQVETLYCMILEELAKDNGTGCKDILVMAPDIRPWRAHIEAVFGPPGRNRAQPPENRGGQRIELPWNMSDLSLQGNSDYLTALRLLLDLGRNRWERDKVFALLDNPCFYTRHGFGAPERDSFLAFVDDAMVRWGLDGDHRHTMGGGDSNSQSWNAAFDRLCFDLPGHDNLTGAPEQLEYGQAEAGVLGAVYRVLHSIAERLRSWKLGERGLREWIQLHRDLMEEFLASPTETDTNHADAARNTLNNLANLLRPGREALEGLRLDWFTFLRFFQDQLDQVEDGLGHRLANGITFSSLKPWRAVSFPLIILLGMNEGDFPRTESPQAFDLSALARHVRDRGGHTFGRPDAETQDTYAWLETLYAARKGLWIFYTGMDPHTGKDRQPSPFVSWIRSSLPRESRELVESRIPILPGPEETYLPQAVLRTEVREGKIVPPELAGFAVSAAVPAAQSEKERAIDLVELARVFQYPLRACAIHRLNLKPLAREDRREVSEENLSPGYLDQRDWLRSELVRLLQGCEPSRAAEVIARSGMGHRHTENCFDALSASSLEGSLQNMLKGAKHVRLELAEPEGQGLQAVPALESLPEHWTSLSVPGPGGPELWHLRNRGPIAWKGSRELVAYAGFRDSALPSLMEGTGKNKKKSTKPKDQLGAFFALLPLFLAHGLGSRSHQPALAVLASGKKGSGPAFLACRFPPWDTGSMGDGGTGSLQDLVCEFLGLILESPLALYPSLLDKLIDTQTSDERREAWDAYWLEYRDGNTPWQAGGSTSSDRGDSPGNCPYFDLVFPAIPEYSPRIDAILDRFYHPLMQRVWEGVDISSTGSAGSDEGED